MTNAKLERKWKFSAGSVMMKMVWQLKMGKRGEARGTAGREKEKEVKSNWMSAEVIEMEKRDNRVGKTESDEHQTGTSAEERSV